MREILFRGKTDKGEWVYGDLLHPDFCGNSYSIEDFTKEKNNCFDVIPETVGQYTGLTDKNGTKIFEGDIVAFGEYRYTVEWKQDRIGYGYTETADRMLECDGEHCEVIGNIHDNPELLKEGE